MQRNLFRTTERTSACGLQMTMNNSRGSEWFLEKRGLGKFCQDLEISEAFMISLEVSFFDGLFLLF